MPKRKPTREELKAIANSVMTCIHVLNKTAKYEYIPANKKKDVEESFTCSECLDLLVSKGFKSVSKYLQLVHRSCFVEARIK